MPKLTLNAVNKLRDAFTGRITTSHEAHSEFRGQPPVLVPESTEDVERALRLTRAAGRRLFVRSGQSVANDDVEKHTAESSPSAIVSMEALRDIDVDGSLISCGAAVTMSDLATSLKGTDAFLPLSDNPSQSVASAVLSLEASPFLRSDSGIGSLRDAVVEAQIVPTNGKGPANAKTIRNKALQELWAGDRTAVITKLVFDGSKSQAVESNRWALVWMTHYAPKTFAALCDTMFEDSSIPSKVDLSVRVTSSAYGMKLVVIRATGHGKMEKASVAKIVEDAINECKLPNLGKSVADGPGSSVAAWVAAGPCVASPDDMVRRFGSNSNPRPYRKVRDAFLEGVDFAIGDTKKGKERAVGVRAWGELQLTADGQVLARAEILDSRAERSVATDARRKMAKAIPMDRPAAKVSRGAHLRRSPVRKLMRGTEILPSLIPTPGFELFDNRIGQNIIPSFNGEVVDANSGSDYRRAIRQYAASSYSSQVIAQRMSPRYVAKPQDSADIVAAVSFAASKNLKVVTRSGGHQYCGLSSGGSDTLLLDVKQLSNVKFTTASGVPSQVTVGPGIALKDLSPLLREKEVVIPHGECPLVRIGGHVQTGGIGHQLRSLGATLDYVRSFKMVTRDPDNPSLPTYSEQIFPRPQSGANSLRDQVFRAVLGGGPGSWGVLTEITFDLVADTRYPRSEGYSKTYLYERSAFVAAMNQLKLWAERQAAGTLPDGVDYFLSVVSDDFFQFRPKALLVETMSRDRAGVPEIKQVVDEVDAAVELLDVVVSALASPIQGPASLSLIADSGVRDIGLFGLPQSGREFDLPYKKSLHITKVPFTQSFCDGFISLVEDAMDDGLKVVVQAVIGGGEFQANAKRNESHMQRRDALVQLVFDTFYEPGSERLAQQYQKRMKTLLPDYSQGADLRMTWGTFEDAGTGGKQLEMKRQQVQDLYYDSTTDYANLKGIKALLDPDDIFHTSFTVQ